MSVVVVAVLVFAGLVTAGALVGLVITYRTLSDR